MGKKLTQFTVQAQGGKDLFEYLNKHTSWDCDETKKAQNGNINKVGRKKRKGNWIQV